LPAGAVYLSANIPVIEAEDYEDRDAIMNKAEKELERSGVILGDEEILYAMSEELSPEFLLGAKKNKEGILSGKALANDTDFEDIYNKLQNTIIKISNSLIDGCADASPMKINGELPCRYCNMKPVCRKIKK
jgi:ATP-dependent helicase/nuclease subunit B